ncbi:Lrp/AsnC family transcriptional regulator [Mycobacterium sp. BMJ-28]
MAKPPGVDQQDAKILIALNAEPRATALALAERTKLSRNTVQAHLNKLEEHGALRSFDRRIDPASLGYPLSAMILTRVVQRKLDTIADALGAIPEVVEVNGMSGISDLMIHVVARESDDLYRIAGRILDIEGVEQTTTSMMMRKMIEYRLEPLLERMLGESSTG